MAAAPPPPRRPPALMDELVEEILFRLPSDKPACLVRAALVCKRWRRLITDPGFRHRFRQFHRTPPMLGLVVCRRSRRITARFLATSSFRPSDPGGGGYRRNWFLLDARHGRILFYYDTTPANPISTKKELKVWTPATGEVHQLPILQLRTFNRAFWNAALLCAVPSCDHMECTSGSATAFTVVLVGRDSMFGSFTYAYEYSSEADEWRRQPAYIELPSVFSKKLGTCNAALVRNALYFLLDENNGTLEYNFAKKKLSVIGLPPICKWSTNIMLMSSSSVEDGGGRLGFAMVRDFSLCIWLRESAPTLSGRRWTWTQHKVVDLKSFHPVSALSWSPHVIAAADGVFVIWAGHAGVLAINLMSGQVTRVSDADGYIVKILPYMSFFTPELRAASINETPSTGASNSA